MTAEEEVERLRAAIRKHRDYRGDERCWRDDEELYAVLPEGYVPPARDTAVELERCRQYIACRHNPATEYASPQAEIERLTAELATARAVCDSLAMRVVAQSDLLSRRAERAPVAGVVVTEDKE